MFTCQECFGVCMGSDVNPLRLLSWSWALLGAVASQAQFPGQKTWCNPVDLNYQYNFEQKARGISFRSGADPVIVNHLYQIYQVFADQRPALELRALTLDQSYSFAIEAFNEDGVSPASATVRIP